MLSNLSITWNLEITFPILHIDLRGVFGEICAIDFSFIFALNLYLQLIVDVFTDILFAIASQSLSHFQIYIAKKVPFLDTL
jgi:hypothetical protein